MRREVAPDHELLQETGLVNPDGTPELRWHRVFDQHYDNVAIKNGIPRSQKGRHPCRVGAAEGVGRTDHCEADHALPDLAVPGRTAPERTRRHPSTRKGRPDGSPHDMSGCVTMRGRGKALLEGDCQGAHPRRCIATRWQNPPNASSSGAASASSIRSSRPRSSSFQTSQ